MPSSNPGIACFPHLGDPPVERFQFRYTPVSGAAPPQGQAPMRRFPVFGIGPPPPTFFREMGLPSFSQAVHPSVLVLPVAAEEKVKFLASFSHPPNVGLKGPGIGPFPP